jgi:hypothetical protein
MGLAACFTEGGNKMKRFVKICAITGLILLLLGLGITAVSAAMGGRYTNSLPSRLASRVWHNHMPWLVRWGDDRADDWDDWNDPDDTDRSPGSSQIKTVSDPSYAQARKLDVDIDKGVIRVLEKEGISQIQVNVQDTYNRTQCYMDEFTLKVKRESGRSRGNEAPRIEILIPAGYGLDKLSLDLGAAECTVLGVTVSKLEIDTGVGAITFSGTVNGDVEIETGVGDVTLNLTGSQDGYNYQVECGVGSIDVGAEHYSMLSHETHINNKAPYTMELECGVGNIAVNFDQIL